VKVRQLLKRTLDLVIALLVAVLLAPLLVVIALLVKLDSRGPVLFMQNRLGLGGTVFSMYKFRTMVRNAEQMGTGLFSYEGDPRVTRVGRLLRQASLDELPQVINVHDRLLPTSLATTPNSPRN
jgi:undecaprenyl phosphate N,N'-diacetylbacillosamine 1-phosphate transferase